MIENFLHNHIGGVSGVDAQIAAADRGIEDDGIELITGLEYSDRQIERDSATISASWSISS